MSRRPTLPAPRRWRHRILPGLALAAAAVLLAACEDSVIVATGGFPRLSSSEISESSGLVASRRFHGIFWTHNDSKDTPRLFAITSRGSLVQTVQILGAEHVDWEAIAADDAGYLYIGDIGNNGNRRKDLRVYRVREPDPYRDHQVRVETEIPFRYPDQTRFPDRLRRNFDAEALFWAQGELYLVTKHRSDTRATLYRFPRLSGGVTVSLVPLGGFDLGGQRNPPTDIPVHSWLSWRAGYDFGGMATGAAATADGGYLALLSYHAVFLFKRPERGGNYLAHLVQRIDFDETTTLQCEAVAWAGSDLLFTNEQGTVHRIEAPLLMPVAGYPPVLDSPAVGTRK